MPEERHKVPDTVLDGVDLDGLTVRGASVRGDGARRRSDTRRDAMCICRVREGEADVILGCVAAGVVGEPLSHLGAEQACALVSEEARPRLSALLAAASERDLDPVGRDLAESVADRLTRLAGFLKVEPQALSTEFTVALVDTGSGQVERRFAAISVGGGTALLLRSSVPGPSFAINPAGGGTPATAALPAKVGQVATASGRLAPGERLLICTGGLGKAMRNAVVRDVLADRWGKGLIPSIPEFGWHLTLRVKTNGDEDRTAIGFWNHFSKPARGRRLKA